MRRKIVYILVCMLVFTTVAGAMSSSNTEVEVKSLSKASTEEGYSHNILGEFFTMTTCEPCKYSHRALTYLYAGNYHPFYYITMVYDENVGNKWAKQRKEELGIYASPTVAWDGGYRKDQGATGVQEAMNRYNTSIIKCGNRAVADIDLVLDVEWLGAVNPVPADNATWVPIEQIMKWTVTAMNIDVTVDNNENSQYNGHLHVYVTEANSTYWDDKFGDPYTFAFLDYAWNENVTITAGGTWDDSTEWDGVDHHNGYGEFYNEITQDNCMVIASVFDENNNDYTDETTGFLAGVGTDPKLFDIYFGNITPPPLVESNTSIREYVPDPEENLSFNMTYYWKIDVWDIQGNPTYGDIWNFTTRDNNPPNTPSDPIPYNNSFSEPIDTNLSWVGGDPDWDDVTYDVYFGVYDPMNPPPQVAWNQSETTYDPSPYGNNLEFDTKYYWRIVAWDEYGLNASGPIWSFRTQLNLPPNKASDPFPKDGEFAVPVNVTLSWNGSDPNSGDTIKYDVYFDDVDPPKQSTHNQTVTYHDPYGQQDLSLYKTYYWKIVTWDSQDESSDSGVWEFTTGINHKPYAPTITGPTSVKKGVNYWYNFTATDQDGHDVKYYIDWDDGNTEWTEFHASGETVIVNHTWKDEGEYNISAKARDFFGLDGDWGYLEVTVPVNQNSQSQSSSQQQSSNLLLEWILASHPIFNRMLNHRYS